MEYIFYKAREYQPADLIYKIKYVYNDVTPEFCHQVIEHIDCTHVPTSDEEIMKRYNYYKTSKCLYECHKAMAFLKFHKRHLELLQKKHPEYAEQFEKEIHDIDERQMRIRQIE